MTPLLLFALVVFALALVHALVIMHWRAAIREPAPTHHGAPDDAPPTITVIVPARNAGSTIQPLLQDLYAQGHPHERTEVIVVDDHSEDGTAQLVAAMMSRWPQLRIATLSGTQGKKAAITEGVRLAGGALVLITDADARCGPDRLAMLAAQWQRTQADMLLAPVRTTGEGPIGVLQEEEQAAFQGATMGSCLTGTPLLANGANMAFTRSAFERVQGYSGDRRSSGDDMFLLSRMKRAGLRIGCLVEGSAAVDVPAEHTLAGFVAQRLRWAGKMRAGSGWSSAMGALAVLLPYLLAAVTATAIERFRFGQGMERTWLLVTAGWLLWVVPVVALVNATKRRLGLRQRSFTTVLAVLCHPLYTLPIALLSFVVKPEWRNRTVQ